MNQAEYESLSTATPARLAPGDHSLPHAPATLIPILTDDAITYQYKQHRLHDDERLVISPWPSGAPKEIMTPQLDIYLYANCRGLNWRPSAVVTVYVACPCHRRR